VIAVPPAYTSQDCSGVLADGSRCTQRVAKSQSVRTHVCPSCGLVMDRDENAAVNIRRAGQARQAPTWVDTPSVADQPLACAVGSMSPAYFVTVTVASIEGWIVQVMV
jgi:putative transposase